MVGYNPIVLYNLSISRIKRNYKNQSYTFQIPFLSARQGLLFCPWAGVGMGMGEGDTANSLEKSEI